MNLNTNLNTTWPAGFKVASAWCGIKKEKLDLTLLVSDFPAASAAVFTTNVCCAAPVQISRAHLSHLSTKAILVNSGNANAATGSAGMLAAQNCIEKCANALTCDPKEVLMASTGIIGKVLPQAKIIDKLDWLVSNLSDQEGDASSEAILTTDTFVKQCGCSVELSNGTVKIGAMAKGSGMIMPNMATMLGFVTTDAKIEKERLQAMLKYACDQSFNRITVDGDTSTNDSVFMLANGASGVCLNSADDQLFSDALTEVCIKLAKMIVHDAEGATKFVNIIVEGCKTEADAEIIGRTIANSPLVKTALYGENPNWGRVLAAAGRAGVNYDQDQVDLYINDSKAVANGQGAGIALEDLAKLLKSKEITLRLVLKEGDSQAQLWTCDLTHAYVDINVAYS